MPWNITMQEVLIHGRKQEIWVPTKEQDSVMVRMITSL